MIDIKIALEQYTAGGGKHLYHLVMTRFTQHGSENLVLLALSDRESLDGDALPFMGIKALALAKLLDIPERELFVYTMVETSVRNFQRGRKTSLSHMVPPA